MQQMKRQGSKVSIVSIASVNTFLAVPYMPAYTSAKHALIGLTKHASNKGGPLGRSDFLFGKRHEVAQGSLWLASDCVSYVNGICLPIDGGVLAKWYI
ncbi:uncharacterized protein N7469_011009 [Penicillium citrinum]|uniref:Uncharacterized protein n=2 Tax=Penicillium TaxID=5073 RepID=A0A9W9TGM0_PENCI|nr:uncharacterized protein N7469_011009 [Penicillium citrinum]KAJ5222122.1 hypothetical protein N7469_011009 [Penicillium citrinum]KAJ5597098.1 hypothetical protein N7450_003556 [Penicillium hetheringtonii]